MSGDIQSSRQTAAEGNSVRSLRSMKHLEDVGLHEAPPLQRVRVHVLSAVHRRSRWWPPHLPPFRRQVHVVLTVCWLSRIAVDLVTWFLRAELRRHHSSSERRRIGGGGRICVALSWIIVDARSSGFRHQINRSYLFNCCDIFHVGKFPLVLVLHQRSDWVLHKHMRPSWSIECQDLIQQTLLPPVTVLTSSDLTIHSTWKKEKINWKYT